ncbi:MAG: VOC family protein [Clostridia bacterium]|nr:VOC family protein [Clostridia bacterium]
MKIEHAAIWTENLEKMREFYAVYFGGTSGEKYVNATKGFESYFVRFDSGARLELMKMRTIGHKIPSGEQWLGFAHLAFSVGSEEEVNRLTEALRRDGFEVIGEPRRTGDGYYESCILDPEGNRVEITA